MSKYIKSFQEKHGLIADGIIGKNTINKMMITFDLSKEEVSHFLGQTHHESMGFNVGEENLNYSAKRLLQIFPKYFTPTQAVEYERNPEKIANRVYANRMGNGSEDSGDGWKYRGRSAIQLTFRNNYEAFSKYMGNPCILEYPEWVEKEYFFEAALFYFKVNNLWTIANKGVNTTTVKTITRKINGGYNGLDDRIHKTNYYYSLIN